jgi:hypothetical protein
MSDTKTGWIECVDCGDTWTNEFALAGVDWCPECGGHLTYIDNDIKNRVQFNGDAYDAGEKAFERGQPKKCPYPADDDRSRFWFMGYESGEAIEKMMLEREERS